MTDTQVHSDLDPLEAPEWSVEVSLVDRPDCLLSRHLDSHLQVTDNGFLLAEYSEWLIMNSSVVF